MVAIDFIVGIIGNVISVISYVAPVGQFTEIVKKKSAEHYDGSPYVTSLLSCCLWTFYGILDPDDGVLVVTVNAIGIFSQVIYLALLLLYYPKDNKVKYTAFILIDILFFGVVIAVTMAAFHEESRRTFVGILCASFTIIMYASPLTVVRTVIQTKTAEYMPVFLIFTLWLNGVIWMVFALLLSDFFILVPNAVGIVLGTIQLLVYFVYRNSSPSSFLSEELPKGGVIVQTTEESNAAEEEKSQGPPSGSNIRNPSLSRTFSFKKVASGISLARNPSRSSLQNGIDLESGNSAQDS
ncbi:Bidirectional sugar transporter SWEET [Heracleum sosnowskyi]|uniref:Bidirectional sugar transporter SWEET n=1 Tax=Heracleum sosnowskyi TaxID=360622 RepID=A0AAD8IQ76_9APIA|nr:Bidirectional sugar transporter SWEET [Heracleum sosnowskyi]